MYFVERHRGSITSRPVGTPGLGCGGARRHHQGAESNCFDLHDALLLSFTCPAAPGRRSASSALPGKLLTITRIRAALGRAPSTVRHEFDELCDVVVARGKRCDQ